LTPDSSYRFVPGGAQAIESSDGLWKRDSNAELFDCATYEPMMRPLIGDYQRFLPLQSEPRIVTPLWTWIVRAFHFLAPSRIGDQRRLVTPFEAFVLFCIAGWIVVLGARHKAGWLVASAMTFQVLGSAFLVGPVPRYAIPIQPLLAVGGAYLAVTSIRAITTRRSASSR
jgi:hypothetical protein